MKPAPTIISTKPFELSELHARLRALTRRPRELKEPVIEVGELKLDTDKHVLTRSDRHIHLTRKEYSLMENLMRNSGIAGCRAPLLWTIP